MHFINQLIISLLPALAIHSVSGSPISLSSKDVQDIWIPAILEPNANTIWTVGHREIVTWNTSNAPGTISNAGRVVLRGAGDLAGSFDLRTGSIQIVVPEVPAGEYSIVLFGDSGNISPNFQIIT